jgi:hypothetical protein
MKNYNLKFIFSYIECNNFKEKDLILLRNFISGCRLGREIKFSHYANVTFDENDKKHDFPIVTEIESFTRGKTNGIVFDMENTSLNNGVFTKCFIYQTLFNNSGAYGYILFNDETNEITHSFNIEYDANELVKHIYTSITSINKRPMLKEMLAKSLEVKKKKNIAA